MQYATTSHLHLRLVVCVLFNTHTKNKALILPEAQTCRSLRSETCSVALQSNDSDVLTIWLNCLYICTNPNKDGIHRIFLLVACSSERESGYSDSAVTVNTDRRLQSYWYTFIIRL